MNTAFWPEGYRPGPFPPSDDSLTKIEKIKPSSQEKRTNQEIIQQMHFRMHVSCFLVHHAIFSPLLKKRNTPKTHSSGGLILRDKLLPYNMHSGFKSKAAIFSSKVVCMQLMWLRAVQFPCIKKACANTPPDPLHSLETGIPASASQRWLCEPQLEKSL